MSTYAVGDIQGCFKAFECLLNRIDFNPSKDSLWIAGDLVNRGPQSLRTLRLIQSFGDAAVVVLGNHDLHLLAVHHGCQSGKRKDTLGDILQAEDRESLLSWLQQKPLIHWDASRNMALVHAGIPHIWSIEHALALSAEVEAVLRGTADRDYFDQMYGNVPDQWNEEISGNDRLRLITNYLTRMRFVNCGGRLELTAKESPEEAPEGFSPWFLFPRRDSTRILFGHWAALMGQTGNGQFIGLDTGCVWGNTLTAMDVDSGQLYQCRCDG